METGKEELRIGVFICHCGFNIGGVIDVPAVVEYAKTLPNVVCAEENIYLCSSTGLSLIKGRIKNTNLILSYGPPPRTNFEVAFSELTACSCELSDWHNNCAA